VSTIDINIDAGKLAEVVAPRVTPLPPFFINGLVTLPDHPPDKVDVKVSGPWLFLRTLASGNYPAVIYKPIPWIGAVDTSDIIIVEAVVGIIDVAPFYMLFTETVKGQYGTYTGLDLTSGGDIVFNSSPEGTSALIASGINPGDVLALVLEVRYDTTWKCYPQVYRWDDSTKSWSRIDNQLSFNLTQTYRYKSVLVGEPKGVVARVAIFGATGLVASATPIKLRDVFYAYRTFLGAPLHTEALPPGW
jgi:hypothetical protein